MCSLELKRAVLSALYVNPDFSKLQLVRRTNERGMRNFLLWLDQSGITLYLLRRLQQFGELENLPATFRIQLQRRMDANQKRTETMLTECHRVSECLQKRGIHHAILKGVTLVPEFSPEPGLRHQSDIDFLISAESIDEARAAIFECGYPLERNQSVSSIHFSMPLSRVPTAADDIYRRDYQKQVELHTLIWDDMPCVYLESPADCLRRTRIHEIEGCNLPTLSPVDAFLLQVLHAFRHFLMSWVRLSWLWEIQYFLTTYREHTETFIAIKDRGGDDPVLKDAVGLMLRITNQVFGIPIPEVLREWCVKTLPEPIQCWADLFGTDWALCNISGNKVTLLIHKEFIREPKLWKPYFWERMIPFRGKPSLGKVDSPYMGVRIGFTARQGTYHARRLAFHAASFISFPFQALRWQYALHRARNRGRGLVAESTALRREI